MLSLAADLWHRALNRRTELWRVPAAPGRDRTEWPQWDLSQPRVPVLTVAAGTEIAYRVTLSPGSRIEARCAIGRDSALAAGLDPHAAVEFRITAETAEGRWSTSQQVSPPSARPGHRPALHLSVPAMGAATIVLGTRELGSANGLTAEWINPRVVTPRRVMEAYAASRAAALIGRARAGAGDPAARNDRERLYQLWVRHDEPSRQALERQREWAGRQSRLFSLVTVVPDPAAWRDGHTAASVAGQTYSRWEWLLIVPQGAVFACPPLNGDARIRTITVPPGTTRGHAWMHALREARGEMAGLLTDGDTLSLSALYEFASSLEQHGGADLIYCDEDRIDADGRRCSPVFKPAWSPDLLLSYNYVGRLAMVRVSRALAAGDPEGLCDDEEEWAFLLRLARLPPSARRLTHCLYHRRGTDPADEAQSSEVVCGHLLGSGLQPITSRSEDGRQRPTWALHGDPLVSIIIPSRNAPQVLTTCIDGLLLRTPSPRREIVIVDNGSTDPAVLALYRRLEQDGTGRIVPFDRPFNYSAACNAGAAAATGDLLLFLNNDIEIVEPGWLDELARWAQRREVGIVGAKLLYPDRLIQHAGVVFGIGLVSHIFAGAPERLDGVFGSTDSYRNFTAVTGACQMMRRDVFERLGGYDERYRLTFSDVVLCMEAWKTGYRVVYTPFARLIHHESFTRRRDESVEDMQLLVRYLKDAGFTDDPYFHPHLDSKSRIPIVRSPFEPLPAQAVTEFIERVLAAARPRA